MLQYVYKSEAIGLAEWPQGTLRLDGIEITENPSEADVFVVPGALTQLFPNADTLRRLPYFAGHESRHVLFDCSDNQPIYELPCLFIRCNTRDWYLPRDPNTIAWHWPVENFVECVEVPEAGFSYDVSFQGWISSKVRKESVSVISGDARLKSDVASYNNFCGYIYDTPEGIRRRGEFRRSMRESRIALCPESIPGVLPYRFFEALSAGRVPLLVGSGYVLPFADEIPYPEFIIQCPASEAHRANWYASEFLQKSDGEIIERGKLGRFWWNRLLNRDDYPRTMAYAVKKALKCA